MTLNTSKITPFISSKKTFSFTSQGIAILMRLLNWALSYINSSHKFVEAPIKYIIIRALSMNFSDACQGDYFNDILMMDKCFRNLQYNGE